MKITMKEQLQSYRLKNGLEEADVAFLLGISVAEYCDMEAGAVQMPLKLIVKLCRYYEIKPDAWLSEPQEVVETTPIIEEPVAIDEEIIPAGELTFEDEEEDYPSIYDLDRSKRKVTTKQAVGILKKHGTDVTEEEAEKVLDFVYKMAPIAIKHAMRQLRRDNKLKLYPKGYPLSGKGYTCWLCHHGGDGRMWYDRFGLKCMLCQQAVDQGIVPGEITQDDTLFYSEFDLGHYFSLKGKALREWIKKGLLKPKTITREDGKGKHYQVFLMSDHEGFLPPIKMMRIGGWIEDEEDGKQFYRTSQWYEYVDPFEYLKGYGIMEYMKLKEPDTNNENIDDTNK